MRGIKLETAPKPVVEIAEDKNAGQDNCDNDDDDDSNEETSVKYSEGASSDSMKPVKQE